MIIARPPKTRFRMRIAASAAVLLAASGLTAHAVAAPSPSASYTVCDFIDHRIDVDAQYALTIMVQRGGSSRTAGLAIFTAVKTGRLVGIYQQDRGKPALLAQRNKSSWWTMLGDSKAEVIDWENPPMLVYKKSMAGTSNRTALATEFEQAWTRRSVNVDRSKTPAPKGGSCSKPPPPPPPPSPPPNNKPKPDKRPCPPGTVEGPHGDVCIIAPGGGADTKCSEGQMSAAFQRQKDFCAGVKTGLDLACSLGTNVCDVGGAPGKLACSVFEQVFGHPPPATKPAECNLPRAQFYRKCIVSTVVGESGSMACFPGTPGQIGSKYDRWGGRVR